MVGSSGPRRKAGSARARIDNRRIRLSVVEHPAAVDADAAGRALLGRGPAVVVLTRRKRRFSRVIQAIGCCIVTGGTQHHSGDAATLRLLATASSPFH
jgi:hypothetical protein